MMESSNVNLTPQDKMIKRPRGVFLGIRQVKAMGLNITKCVFLMGILHGFVYKAGFYPKDVEIVVDTRNRLIMYDFGMVNLEYTFEDREIDMYIPQYEDSLSEIYNKGVTFVFPSFIPLKPKNGGKKAKPKKKPKKTS